MNEFQSYHVLISPEDMTKDHPALQGLRHEIFDMNGSGQEAIWDYPREVFSAYALSESLGLNCKSVIYAENMPEANVALLVLSETFDAIFHVENEQSGINLLFANGVQISFDSAKTDIAKGYRQLSGIKQSIELYGNVEMHSYFDVKFEEMQQLHNSLDGIRQMCVDYLRPNILQYLNPTKVSL